MIIFLILASLQGITIAVDEFYFHRKRGMPLWERIGHPADTFAILCCFLFLIFVQKTELTTWIYFSLVALSCLLVTKDEWVHHKYCTAQEMWLHAVLFILHPLVFLSAFQIWGTGQFILEIFAVSVFTFMVYQIFYWNFYENRPRKV